MKTEVEKWVREFGKEHRTAIEEAILWAEDVWATATKVSKRKFLTAVVARGGVSPNE